MDELYKICGVMGAPTAANWPEGVQLARAMGFAFPAFPAIPLGQLLPTASPEALDMMTSMCQWDPAKRPTAIEALRHPYFQVCVVRGGGGRQVFVFVGVVECMHVCMWEGDWGAVGFVCVCE